MSIALESAPQLSIGSPQLGRVLTGDRPTGALHLGHYFGTIANRVRLQQAGHEMQIVIADYQVIADRDHPGDLPRVVNNLVLTIWPVDSTQSAPPSSRTARCLRCTS
jgi:hypothetical protein